MEQFQFKWAIFIQSTAAIRFTINIRLAGYVIGVSTENKSVGFIESVPWDATNYRMCYCGMNLYLLAVQLALLTSRNWK